MWILTNKKIQTKNNVHSYRFKKYIFATDESEPQSDTSQNFCFVAGHVCLRNRSRSEDHPASFELLLKNKRIENDEKLIYHIKGNFVFIQFFSDKFRVYSDHFAIKKFFYWQNDNEFVVTNSLNELSKIVNLKPSSLGMSAYALTYHFTGGVTAFENVFHNQPGEFIEFTNEGMKIKTYWQPLELFNQPRRKVDIGELSETLKLSVKSTLKTSEAVSLSLTGGADTRNLLSVFLSMGITPHLYTYGNSQSNDCVKAAAIAKGLKLEHCVHDIKMTGKIFEENARRIIRAGCGLASIHRVHRLLAVELERNFASQMFLGTLGGEFIKGVSEDDYIVPAIIYENWNNTLTSEQALIKYIEAKRLNITHEIKQKLLLYLHTAPYMKGTAVSRKFLSLTHLTAHLHDAQDVNLYESVMKEVYTPFLDIDYLETLFSSGFTFNNKEAIKNPFLRRIQNPVYGAKFIHATYPPLLKFKYSGEHKPSEVLYNKYLAAFLKGIRQKLSNKYPQNFPLGNWMADFVKENLPECRNYASICEVFDINRLMQDFQNEKHQPIEAYWLKYTNPIMMRFILEEFNHG